MGGLPEQIAARLAQAVEADRLVDGKSLPHEMILEGLRPALRRSTGADRTPTPLRAFCLPFEDLFTLLPRKAKQKGSIARGSVTPVWAFISQTLLVEQSKDFIRDFKAQILAGRQAEARARAAAFWPVAAAALSGALADGKKARGVLGSDLIVADAAEDGASARRRPRRPRHPASAAQARARAERRVAVVAAQDLRPAGRERARRGALRRGHRDAPAGAAVGGAEACRSWSRARRRIR
ncbi:MAG: hypothetical protein WDM81_01915 [Rhizomicrobium sp.]